MISIMKLICLETIELEGEIRKCNSVKGSFCCLFGKRYGMIKVTKAWLVVKLY